MSLIIGLPEKDVLKVNKELLDLHKKVLLNYLLSRSMKLRSRKKFFAIYDFYIGESNIHQYFFTPIKLFVTMLIRDELWRIRKYYDGTAKKHKHKRKKS